MPLILFLFYYNRDSLLVAGYSDPALLDIFGEIPKQNVSSLPTGHGVNNNTLFYWSDLNAPIMDKKSANISEVLDTLLRSYDLSLRPNVDG